MTDHQTIVVATDLTEEGLAALQSGKDTTVEVATPQLTSLRKKLKNANALIIREDITVDEQLLNHAPALKVIGRMGASLGGIDIDIATERGIIVMNTPGSSAIAAGEHTLTLMLALSRKLTVAHNSMKEGWWLLDRKQQAGTQLLDKTVGLIGLGRVGMVVAQRCIAFGMNVLAYDPYVSETQVNDNRITLVGLKELLHRSDYVSIHVPDTAETRGIVGEDVIRQMKPGARLINAAFGAALDEAAAAVALKDGHLAGVAVDVYREEPPYNSPLVGLDNVIHTPHIGDNTIEATQDLSIQIAQQVLDALHGKDYRNVVNMPFLPGLDYDEIRPYLTLAERLGAMQQALARSAVRRVAVEYRGDEMSGMVKPLTVGILKGLLAPVLGTDKVNYINAPVLAAERGIDVTQTKGLRTAEYTNLLSCQVVCEDGWNLVMAGTLLDRREPHIIQIDDYRMNFVPAGHLLVMGSYDQPGVIGRVGTLMANNGVNIASWHTGRVQPGGQTLTVLTLDEPIPAPVLEELRQQDFIRHAVQVEL